MVEHAIDCIEILLGLIVEFLGLLLEFLKPALGIDIDGILRIVSDVESMFEGLRSL